MYDSSTRPHRQTRTGERPSTLPGCCISTTTAPPTAHPWWRCTVSCATAPDGSASPKTTCPGIRVHAPDLRGHGRSTTQPPWTFEQHADDVREILDTLHLDQAVVVGHSLGATIAVHLSQLIPGRIRRLILLDPGIGLPEALAAKFAAEAPSPVIAATWTELAREPVAPAAPTTLVRARRSKAVPPGYPGQCATALGEKFRLVELDCGHQVHEEKPAETAELIRAAVSGTP
ncbi:alpha/beta hydrolase [Actinoplanes sp. LDG1-06]|uniref:Alpha/beta hydrolase n=1 Tax=Paractinoplanes ovalisporus TaxID=2810368 RepID=A0ABS2A8I4_9ACTN|nr:alpha/beta hydrolase [Actinoplanes ovalisporus]